MVKFSSIQQSNSQLNESSIPHVAVFIGGTAGIGKLTLGAITRLGTNFKAYVIGRKSTESSFKPFITELQQANPNATLIWIEGEVSLLSEAHRTCAHIKSLETSIDLLFMTTGYAPFRARQNTAEGLDISHALNLYTRICFAQTLLPLLRASSHGRVISVHSGGLERAYLLDTTDMNLERPGAFSATKTQLHMGMMNTLVLERLAEMPENKNVIFIHSHPGIVRTGNLYRGFVEGSWGMWMAGWVMDPLMRLLAFSDEESAERHSYIVTSGNFGGHGPLLGPKGRTARGEERGGLFSVNWKCDTVRNEKEMGKLREKAGDVVWEKVQEIIGPYA